MQKFIKTRAKNTILKKIVQNGNEEYKNLKKQYQDLQEKYQSISRKYELFKLDMDMHLRRKQRSSESENKLFEGLDGFYKDEYGKGGSGGGFCGGFRGHNPHDDRGGGVF